MARGVDVALTRRRSRTAAPDAARVAPSVGFRFGPLHRAAMVFPGRKPLAEMGGIETHVLQGRHGERGAPAACAVQHESLAVLAEDLLEIGAFGVDPELDHAPWRVNAAGDESRPHALADIADVDDDHVGVVE